MRIAAHYNLVHRFTSASAPNSIALGVTASIMPYQRIYSEKLDRSKSWYAYNSSITGYQRRNQQHSHEGNILFKSFPSEIQQVNIGDIRESRHTWMTSAIRRICTTKFELVYALSSFGNMFNTNFWNILYLTNVQARAL